MKLLHIKMADGSAWNVPVSIVAWDYARKCAHEAMTAARSQNLSVDVEKEIYRTRFAEVESDMGLLINWAQTEMQWLGIYHHASQVYPPTPADYCTLLRTATITVVDTGVPCAGIEAKP